ncbi:hypothetical protein SAMN05660816_01410 [Niastella yeongjuensis]|nr:hypothetical protein SAMN05660816_01410 [Niastella yeongjuensis]
MEFYAIINILTAIIYWGISPFANLQEINGYEEIFIDCLFVCIM